MFDRITNKLLIQDGEGQKMLTIIAYILSLINYNTQYLVQEVTHFRSMCFVIKGKFFAKFRENH